jgi:serine/threonine protein kinase
MDQTEKYTILDPISIQGMLGDLFRARDNRTGRTVALRVVREEIAGDPPRRTALLADARTAQSVSHPHVAALFDVGEQDGFLYLAHEFVPGQSLAALLDKGPMEADAAVELALQVAEALAHVHRQGLVYRTLSGASVIVNPRDQAKLLDVGFASWTAAGHARLGLTPQVAEGQERPDEECQRATNRPASYLSPEEALGEKPVPRSDLFSLGILLYQMVTGQMPFDGGSDQATAFKILHAVPPAPSSLNRSLPPGFDAVVAGMLRKTVDMRPHDAGAAIDQLRRLRRATSVATAEPSEGPRWMFWRKSGGRGRGRSDDFGGRR